MRLDWHTVCINGIPASDRHCSQRVRPFGWNLCKTVHRCVWDRLVIQWALKEWAVAFDLIYLFISNKRIKKNIGITKIRIKIKTGQKTFILFENGMGRSINFSEVPFPLKSSYFNPFTYLLLLLPAYPSNKWNDPSSAIHRFRRNRLYFKKKKKYI